MSSPAVFDLENKEVLLCAMQYLFVRTEKEKGTMISEGCVSFATENGFFAALGHNEDPQAIPYLEAEIYAQHTDEAEPPQAGRVLRSMPSGVYGAFYDDYTPPVFSRLRIAPLDSLVADAPAELWMPVGAGDPFVFKGKIAALFPDKPHPVLFEVDDPVFPGAQFGCSGSVIVQNGKIAAVVAGANENPATLLYCTAAERMAVDLERMIYGLAVAEDGNTDCN